MFVLCSTVVELVWVLSDFTILNAILVVSGSRSRTSEW